jgi:hypothetical protein
MEFPGNLQQQIMEELQSNDVIVFTISRAGKYLSLLGGNNRAFYADGSQLIGKHFHDVLRQEKADYFQSLVDEVIKTEKPLEADYELGISDFDNTIEGGPDSLQKFHATILPFHLGQSTPLDRVIWIARNTSIGVWGEQSSP